MPRKKTQATNTHEFQEYFWMVKDYEVIPVNLFWGLIRFDWKRYVGEKKVMSGLCNVCDLLKENH